MPDSELSVLYVDDEAILLDITKKFLTSLGFQVDTSESGVTALKMLSQTRYDAIVSDYQMPEMDGISLLKEIRSRYPDLPFILFTGRGREEIVIEAIENGADFYLQKGGTPRPQFAELAHKIRRAVHLRRDEAALVESEARFNKVAENAGEWIWETDAVGLYKYCSSAVKKILGYQPEELVGKIHFYDLFDPETREEQTKQTEALMKEKISVREVIGTYQHKNGEKVVLQSSGSAVFRVTGELAGFWGIHLDVTERKRNEEIIRLNEKRLVRAQEIGRTGNWEFDLKTGLLWGSENAIRMFGYHRPAGSITIEEIESCIVERDRVHQSLVDLITKGKEYNIEYTILPADDSPQKTILSIASQEPDEQGQGNKVIGVILDITERKRAEDEIRRMSEDIAAAYEELVSSEEELRANYQDLAKNEQALSRSEALMRGLFDTMPSGTTIFRVMNQGRQGSDYIIVDINKHALVIENKKKEEVIGRSLTDLMPAIDEYGLIPVLCNVWETGEAAIYPAKIYVDEKISNWLEYYVFRLPSGEIVAIYNDVTEKIQATHNLAQSEKHYRILAESLKDVVWILDTDSLRFRYVSPSVLQLRGYTAEEVMASPVDDAITPDSAEYLKDLIKSRASLYRSGKGEPFYTNLVEEPCKDGSKVWTEVITSYYFNEETGTVDIRGVSRDISERIVAEQALKESEDRYRTLMQIMPVSLCLVHNNIEITYCNDRFTQMLGYTREDIPTLHDWWQKAYPDEQYRMRVIAAWETFLADAGTKKNEIRPYEYKVCRKDGVTRTIEISGIRLDDDYLVTMLDVTERRNAESALSESEVKFRSLVENSLESILILDLQGTVLFANHAAYHMVETDEDQILKGINVMEFIDPISRDEVLKDFSEVIHGHDSYLAQYHVITRKERHIQVESIGKLISYEGEPAIILSIHDITIRRMAEEALAESQEKYQQLFELGNEAVFLIDNKTGALLEANWAASEMYGYSHEELTSMTNADLSAEPEETTNVTTNTQAGTIVVPLRFHKKKNGEVFRVEITGRFFTWKDRSVHVAAIRDITERKRAEDALIQANRQLSLLSDVTRHDILNMISVIFGYLDVAKEESISPVLSECLNKIERSTRTIQSEIEFTRLYQNLGTSEPGWMEVKALLPYNQIPQGVMFKAEIPDIWINADPMLEKVLYNLLDNSIRHGKKVTTITLSASENENNLTLVYQDDGIGIPHEEKEKIFERGFGKNSGLGLFLVRDILSITGITIIETGKVGDGARFEILIPKGAFRIKGRNSQS